MQNQKICSQDLRDIFIELFDKVCSFYIYFSQNAV